MSVQDIIKKSVLRSENFTTQNAGKIVATLLFAIALGAFIYFVYQKFFTGVVYSRSFAMTLIGMSILTAMVTLAISSNVVISLGKRWARTKQFAFIQMGSLGHWGEWHVNDEANIRKLPEADVREKYITPWIKAFPKANILMRRPFATAKKHGFGLYNDVVGDEESKKVWLNWIQSGGDYDQEEAKNGLVAMPKAWETAPIGGEFTSSVSMKTLMSQKLPQIVRELQESHTTFLGPKIAEVLDGVNDTSYNEILKNMGYRLFVPNMKLISSKKSTKLTLSVTNKGVAPLYRNWTMKVYVLNKLGAIIESKTIPIDLTKLLPNQEQKVQASLSTANITGKGYKIALGIISPLTQKPAVCFANKGQENKKMLTLYED
ncbi:DUF4832 domain-containing protein [Streptococcus intermedius]|uniref:DUF4832 domain-containing protein n=1 Tax=Streptococcus intermedius TaxID=1338 RepID=UPI0021553BA3|nr:DUF4832 domain-containing protein [Streptococcus intermedius]